MAVNNKDNAAAKPKNLGGCPPKYTPEEFAIKVDAFILYCDSKDIDATDYQIINYFKISPTTLDRYRSGDNPGSEAKDKDKYNGFGAALKKIDLYREDATIRQARNDPKMTGHAAFKLKQAHWGGWTDKQVVDSNVKQSIEFKVTGINGINEK